MNVKNERLDSVLLVEYKNVYVPLNASLKDGYRAFLSFGHMKATICTYVATPLANVIRLELEPSIQMLLN